MPDGTHRPTADDVGEPVVGANEGIQLGTISSVEGDTVYVDTDPDLADDVRASIGWGELNETYPVDVDAFTEQSDNDTFRIDLASINDPNQG